MRKLPEVEQAKQLMMEAQDWSVFTWLFEKRRVRETADLANAVLDKLNRAVKTHWSDEMKLAYKEVSSNKQSFQRQTGNGSVSVSPETRALLDKVKEADYVARRARETAEATFDEAERRLDTELAREGCRQAIHSWELHEKAIRKAESVPTMCKLSG